MKIHKKRIPDDAVLAVLGHIEASPVLIGGAAMAAYGLPTATTDIDLLVKCNLRELRRIVERLRAKSYRLDPLSEMLLGKGNSVELRCFSGGNQIDILRASSARLKGVYSRATLQNWCGRSIRVAQLVDVLIEKIRFGKNYELAKIGDLLGETLTASERVKGARDCIRLGLGKNLYANLIFGDPR